MRWTLLFAIVLSLAAMATGVYLAYRQAQSTTTPDLRTLEAPPGTIVNFHFTVQAGQVTGPESFVTTQGKEVVIRVTSDVSDEVHLHGYDLSKDVEAGGTVEIRFTAETAGRFELELEQRKLSLGFLEVQPL